jgi:hypothetical protein
MHLPDDLLQVLYPDAERLRQLLAGVGDLADAAYGSS